MDKCTKFIKIISAAAIFVTLVKTSISIFKSSSIITAAVKLIKSA